MTTSVTDSGLRAALLDAGLLVATGVDGLYHRSGAFEAVARGVAALVHRAAADQQAPVLHFAPVVPRATLELTDYLRSFPDLIGSVEVFAGDDAAHAELLRVAAEGGDWSDGLTPAEVVLCSAACHPLWGGLRGTLPPGGRRFEVEGWCFRHEPSLDPARLQSFRQHEVVYVGDAAGAVAHRDLWLQRGLDLLTGLGLPVEAVVANDPFFGRAGRLLKAGQREATLKYEIVCPVTSPERPTAVSSANCHLDHFGVPYGITTADGEPAHSACIGFGLERVTLALVATHGVDLSAWPSAVLSSLNLDPDEW